MDAHIRALRKEEFLIEHGGPFDEENAERVVSWLVAAEERSPVVLVGAGFTLNARDRRTGRQATRTQAPLWSDVVAILAKDLGLSAERYEAPTLFEMYKEHFNEAKFRDALRATVANSDLAPGAAHEALVAYPSEAIVTTNCLDTLLDEACGSRWRRVVADPDLSTAGEGHDLIYLHGHREFSDSWVMTRSQYEDVPRQKPVIVARVRQLLAQHPWLVVGFGMTDPNLHSIIRLLGSEMRSHQPLSLALMRDTPMAAERLHWRRLGFEIASPRDKEHVAEFLALVLPKLVTTYSPTSTAAKGYIRRGSTPTEKLRRFRDVHPAPIIDREEAYVDWKDQLKELLSAEEQSAAKARVNEAHQAAWTTRSPPPKTEGNSPVSEVVAGTRPATPPSDSLFDGLDIAPKFRPLASFEEVHWLSILLSKGLLNELAEHFAWALTHQIFEDRADLLPLEVFAIRLASRAGWKASNADRIHALLRAACASARKYGREMIEELVKGEAAALELPLTSGEDYRDRPHLLLAKAGYQALMNANFHEAAERYAEAARLVAHVGLVFEEWVYAVGEADALSQLGSPTKFADRSMSAALTREEEKRRLQGEALHDRIRELTRRRAVERWISRADEQSRSVLQEVVERSAERERFRARGSWGRRFGGNGHALWKSFRDLETVHAPPSLRRKYLEPLLPLLNASHLALVLPNARKPREWLDAILDRPTETVAERRKRDRELIEVLLPGNTLTKAEILARVECLRECNDIFRKEDFPEVLKWLERGASSVLDGWKETAGGSKAIGQDFWPAFSVAARWADASAACATADVLVKEFGVAFPIAEEAIRALYDLPWHTWQPLERQTAARLLDTLTQLVPATQLANARVVAVTGYALFTLFRMLEAGLAAETLTPSLDRWKAVLTTVKESRVSGFGECRRAGFLVERKLAVKLGDVRSPASLFDEWFGSEISGARDDHEEEWATLVEVIDDSGELLGRLGAAVALLLNDEQSLRHYALNPNRSYQAVALLTKGIKHLSHERSRIGPFLLRLLAVAPNYIGAIAESVVREWWEAKAWSDLMVFLVAVSGGGLGISGDDDIGSATRRQLAVLNLFGRLQPSSLAGSSRSVWYSMQSLALSAATDERLLVANHAAFAVVSVAEKIEDAEDAALYASALGRIARDPRVPIRSALADAGPRLAEHAKMDDVRGAAREAMATLEGDDNAQVSALLARAKAAVAGVHPASAIRNAS